MARTRRAYNNPRKRIFHVLTKFDQKTTYEPDYESFVKAMQTTVLCMGHCPRCQDRKRDQQARTQKKKEMKFL